MSIVRLFLKTGELVSQRSYYLPCKRKKVIRDWKNIYGSGFYNCFLQFAPDANDELVNNLGENVRRRKVFVGRVKK